MQLLFKPNLLLKQKGRSDKFIPRVTSRLDAAIQAPAGVVRKYNFSFVSVHGYTADTCVASDTKTEI